MNQRSEVVAHAVSYKAEKMCRSEQEIGHGAEQGAVPSDSGPVIALDRSGAVLSLRLIECAGAQDFVIGP